MELSKQINAALQEMMFSMPKYDPSTEEGQRLLAHELAHVIQQEGERITIRAQPGLWQQRPAQEKHMMTYSAWVRLPE
jgi:hypothetical protein